MSSRVFSLPRWQRVERASGLGVTAGTFDPTRALSVLLLVVGGALFLVFLNLGIVGRGPLLLRFPLPLLVGHALAALLVVAGALTALRATRGAALPGRVYAETGVLLALASALLLASIYLESLLLVVLNAALVVGAVGLPKERAQPAAGSLSAFRRAVGQTQFALLVYAILFGIVVVLLRNTNGFFQDNRVITADTLGLPSYMFASDRETSVYDKGHIRASILQFVLFAGIAVVVGSSLVRYARNRLDLLPRLHPASAIFALLLPFAALDLPPYRLDLAHWSVFLGPALDVELGRWPYLHVQSGYGFLPPAVLRGWLALFPLSQASLVGLVAAANGLAAIIAYVLFALVTRSRWAALLWATVLSYAFLPVEIGILYPNLGALRWELMLVAAPLCLWLTLSRTGLISQVAGVAFGLAVLWDPPSMFLPAFAYGAVHLYRFLSTRQWTYLQPIAAAAAGALVPLVLIVLIAGWPADGLAGIAHRASVARTAVLAGFSSFPQTVSLVAILAFLVAVLTAARLFRRLRKPRPTLTRDDLFLVGALISALPALVYYLGRSVDASALPLAWAIAPPAALLAARAHRFLRARRYPTWPLAAALAVFLVNFNILTVLGTTTVSTPSVNVLRLIGDNVSGFFTKYESARYEWWLSCNERLRTGDSCELAAEPGLLPAVRAATGPAILFDQPQDQILLAACRRGIPMVSLIDAWVYAYGGCAGRDTVKSMHNTWGDTLSVQRFLADATQADSVLVDYRHWGLGYWTRFAEYVAEALRARGFGIEEQLTPDISRFTRAPLPGSPVSPPRLDRLLGERGSWSFTDSTVRVQRQAGEAARAWLPVDNLADDLSFSARVWIEEGNEAGLLVRTANGAAIRGASVSLARREVAAWRQDGAASDRTIVATRRMRLRFQEAASEYDLQVSVKAGKLYVWLDRTCSLLFQLADPQPGWTVGFWASDTRATFSHILTSPVGAECSVE